MESQLSFFNTLTRKKESIEPLEPGRIKMYTCGPTVYNHAHIGNFRTYVFEDLLRRTLQFFGLAVTQVMNLTDVDDKTIKGAIEKGVTLDEYTAPYKEGFFRDLDTLGIERAEYYPAATDYIPQMITMIEELLAKEVAYQGADGSVYYAIGQFANYGCLSHLKQEDLKVGASARLDADEYDKDNASDFVLWKAYDPKRDGEIYWESPFGRGRPGWHLECSAMAMDILGETIDIHVGAVDNIFPHHENEIAQSEACSGETFVKHWMHSLHLIVDGKKMAKSAGNFYTLQDLLDRGYSGSEVRMMLLQTHYRTQLNFTFEELEAVRSSLKRINGFVERLQEIPKDTRDTSEVLLLTTARNRFAESLADDLNISIALSVLFDVIREFNTLMDAQQLSYSEAQEVLYLFGEFNQILGIMTFEREEETLPLEVKEALEKRAQARSDKNWALSDELRDLIATYGYLVEDTPTGQKLEKA